MSESQSPFRIEATSDGARFSFDVVATPGSRQTKIARFADFEILCDEGAEIGGDDSAPPPLAYFAASIAF